MKGFIAVVAVSIAGLGYAVKKDFISADWLKSDPFIWLEEVLSDDALNWVKAKNKSVTLLTQEKIFPQLKEQAYQILSSQDKLTQVTILGDMVYNFWQDPFHKRGLWRRSMLEDFMEGYPLWETVIDFDALEAEWQKNIVYKGAKCLAPDYERCMIALSDGGKDAVSYYEFDLIKKDFVESGFYLPEAKSTVTWQDRNHLVVATDFGPGTMTDSGYPRIVKLWQRGTGLTTAKHLHSGVASDVSVRGLVYGPKEDQIMMAMVSPSFFETQLFLTTETESKKLLLPSDIKLQGVFKKHLIIGLRSDFNSHKEGDLIAIPLHQPGLYNNSVPLESIAIFQQSESRFLKEAAIMKDHMVLAIMENVRVNLATATIKNKEFKITTVDSLPQDGDIDLGSSHEDRNTLTITYSNYLTPSRLIGLDVSNKGVKSKTIQTLPSRFDETAFVSQLVWATSKDGTKVPYTVIRHKNMPFHGKNPTILYGYGGFEVSLLPSYLTTEGKLWLEKGGVYAVANIRGGGEFGPKWHQSALKSQRQKAYDDFISVAEHLISQKVTSPRHLGIMGGSNGGLLMGVMMTQRPELFQGVVCSVPLLDMLRFHTLLAGASWMAEYGNPDLNQDRKYIQTYSPYQKLGEADAYPEVFFTTSTRDDRVHPAHARKMAAKMEALGHPFYYYENIDGGHGGSANLEQSAHLKALTMTYFHKKLF